MAQFLMAKFLSDALVWKYTHPTDPFYAGLAYESYIYKKARLIFSNYSDVYKNDKDFTTKIALALQSRDPNLIRIIYPEKITPQMKATDNQFEAEIKLERQRISQEKTPILKQDLPPPPLPPQEGQESNESEVTEGKSFQLPKLPAGFRKAALGAGSALSLAFQKNFGKHFTFNRVYTGVFAMLGGILGGVISGGNPVMIAVGAGAGAAGSNYLASPEGRSFLYNLGRGNVNSGANSPTRRSKKSWFKGGRLLLTSFALAFVLLLFFGGFAAPFLEPLSKVTPFSEAAPVPGSSANLSISMIGPEGCTQNCKADNNQEITYQISLTYSGTGNADIEVFGNLPDGVIPSRKGSEKWNVSGKSFSQIISSVASKETKRLSLTFKPDSKTDFWATLFVTATVKPNPVGADSCQTKYALTIAKNPDKSNFGDPKCNFTKDDLYLTLKQQDQTNADFWYFKVVPCESGYNPNEYYRCDANSSNCTPDPTGAWGLFQMGRGKNGPLDRGDVNWPDQIFNAINYNKVKLQPSGLSIGSYWACAR